MLDTQNKIARIYRPQRSTMQAGRGKTKKWLLECSLESARAPEPLIGWISSEDTMNQIRLSFDTKEQAIEFAESKGWQYIVDSVSERKLKPRNYLDNFKYHPKKDKKT